MKKVGQTLRSRTQGQNCWFQREDLVSENIHLKLYQSSSTHCSKVNSKVNALTKWVGLQGQGHRIKNVCAHGKALPLEILMWNV